MKFFSIHNHVKHHIMVCHYQCMVNICMFFAESMWPHVHKFLCCPWLIHVIYLPSKLMASTVVI